MDKIVSDDEMKGFIKELIPYELRNSRDINEVFIDLKTEINKSISYEKLNTNENLINFQDGLYDIKTDTLIPHSPEILSTIQIPAKYEDIKKSDKQAPVFMKYMNTLCNNDEQTINLLLQCIGICISNIYAYRTKKALFLVGPGDSRKKSD